MCYSVTYSHRDAISRIQEPSCGFVFMKILLSVLFTLCLVGCSTMQPSDFEGGRPVFDPAAFFTGRTESTGVMENRSGTPLKRVTTTTHGIWKNGVLHIEQDLVFGDEPPSHRSWRLRKIDAHHFEATANDMVGTARGQAHGNAFHWSFTLATSPGNPLANVRMSQWMYLQPDGRTMVNHTTIHKAGILLRQVTEQFRRAGP